MRVGPAAAAGSLAPVIYCVVPEPMAGEMYDRMVEYYADDPNVTVIVDRRKRERRAASAGQHAEQRELRDRRRRRPGEIPALVAGD